MRLRHREQVVWIRVLVVIWLFATIRSVHAATGLDFPSNGDAPSDAFVAFQFLNPQNRGLPIWGPSNQGATYIWKYRPRQQNGYYVTFWWSQNDGHFAEGGRYYAYYGCHPYPQGGGASNPDHFWELAGMSDGVDNVVTLSGNPLVVVKDRWYSQACQIKVNADGTKTATFYIDLTSISSRTVIRATSAADYGDVHPDSAITFGDSPWYADYQHERLSGVIRGIKIFNKALSEADIVAEANSDTLTTPEGRANVWYMNVNPTPTDISDKSGAGNHPTWASSTRASLFTDSSTGTVPNPPTNLVVQ